MVSAPAAAVSTWYPPADRTTVDDRLPPAAMVHIAASTVLLERLGQHGEMNSHVVLSTQYEGRPIEPASPDNRPVTPSAGWSQ